MQAWLETSSGRRLALETVFSIGRSSKNSLVLDNPEVSRRHALVHAQGDERWLVDLGSSNGVLINHHRVRQPVRLKDQDRLEIAGHCFVFHEVSSPVDQTQMSQTTVATLREPTTTALWLLVADIEGSTRLCQSLPVEELAQLIGRWFLSGKETLEKFDGTIKDYTGDGFFAYWPEPEQPVASIARTIHELETRQQATPPPFRLAIHYGTVTVDRAVCEAGVSLLGPEVNFLFRMERLAKTLCQRCLLSEAAALRLKAFGEVIPVGSHSVQGFDRHYGFFAFNAAGR